MFTSHANLEAKPSMNLAHQPLPCAPLPDNELCAVAPALGETPLRAAAVLALLHVAVDPPLLHRRAHHAHLRTQIASSLQEVQSDKWTIDY